MTPTPRLRIALLASVLVTLLLAYSAQAGRPRPVHEPTGHLTFTSPQSNPIALSPDGDFLYVANTVNNSVAVVNTSTHAFEKQIMVGLEPVSVAVRPDGKEVWVANHVSDSISVIDTDPASASFRQVVETIQHLRSDGATLFDEPVGIAFASNAKAYVAVSSRNQVAIVDAVNYAVTGSLNIRAQDPRAIAVRNGRLYVAAFESGNQSELSACAGINAPQCTLSLTDLFTFATNPNIPGSDKNIVIDPDLPDRDLFVFNTSNDSEIKVVEGVGTLLYGLAVDASNRVYVTQTDARNHVNGITSDPSGDVNGDGDVNLLDLGNRMFTNEVAILNCGVGGQSCSEVATVDLDPNFPNPATALATPYGIALSNQANPTIVATAAGTSRLFTMDSSGTLLAQLDVGAIPRGVALRSDPGTGAPQTAYVLNTLDTTVTVVDVSDPTSLDPSKILATILVGFDPTPQAVRLGRLAFNDAFASTSGTFACASCHPDGHTDQLLWRIGGECFLGGCVAGEDEARSTMPIRGLRDTLPLHWDGILGDPFGGPNGATGSGGNEGPSCVGGDPHSCFRDLVDASLSGVMCDQTGACPPGGTILSEQEKDDMATFLERVSYPPARSRRIDDSLSRLGEGVVVTDPDGNNPIPVGALEGFQDFFIDQNGGGNPDTCADSNAGCHELPLGTATNSETLQAFDATTMRGMTDRFLQFSLGPVHTEELLSFANDGFAAFGISPLEDPIAWDPAQGFREITTFGAAFAVFEPTYGVRPLHIFQMFEEASTGPSGALGRQVTLNSRTTGAPLLAETEALLTELEAADARGVVNLRGNGLRNGQAVNISYLQATDRYRVGGATLTHDDLIAEAQPPAPVLIATLTAQLRSGVSENSPQPLIAPFGAQCDTGPNTPDPLLPGSSSFPFEGKHVAEGDAVFLNGEDTGLTVSVTGTSSACPNLEDGHITTQLLSVSGLTRTGGTDLLQIRSANGLLSNEMPLMP